jgi:hypothetical protein
MSQKSKSNYKWQSSQDVEEDSLKIKLKNLK